MRKRHRLPAYTYQKEFDYSKGTEGRGINRYGRASQGVRLMNIRDDDCVSAVALVVESEAATAAAVAEDA